VGLPLLLSRLLLAACTLTAPQWRIAVPDPDAFHSRAPRVGGPLLSRWDNWDAVWYLRMAGNGPQMGYSRYTEDPVHHFGAFAFFPLYPLTVRAAATVAPGALDAVPAGGATRPGLLVVALVVANAAFALALLALYALAAARAGPAVARRAVWLLCLFPTTVFFSAPYSESLFLLWLVLFFLALDRRRWWLAGLCGALAAATRSLGAALVVPYLVAWWQATRGYPLTLHPSLPPGGEGEGARPRSRIWLPRTQWRGALPIILIPLGLVGYMVYLKLAWGDPFIFARVQKAWGRSVAAPWVGIVDGLWYSLRPWRESIGPGSPLGHWQALTQPDWRGLTDALYATVFLALTALAWRGMGWVGRSYAVVFWLVTLCEPQLIDLKLHPDTLISTPRFLLALLPLWLWLARSRGRALAVAVPSFFVLLFYAARWVNGAWIG